MNMYFYMFFMLFMMVTMFNMIMLFTTILDEKFYIFSWEIMHVDLFDLTLMFYFDYLSNLFLLVVSMISMVTFLYSKDYMSMDKFKSKFLLLTFLFVSSMYIVILSMNFITILIGWDCLGVTSYFLVVHYNSSNSDYSGMVTIMTNRIGDVGMILALFLSFSFYNHNFLNFSLDTMGCNLFYYFICLACMTKSAQYPFSVWLPLAMAAPTPISALVHSSTLVTAGVYLFIRFDYMFMQDAFFVQFILVSSGLTMLVASFGALSELDIKKIIAYSTLSQLGLMSMAVVMGSSIFSFFHILTHALFKALLFLCSGVLIHSCYENQDIRFYNFNIKSNFFVVSVFFVCSLSLSGFPFLSGFYSKDLILEYVYMLNYNLFFIFLLFINTMMTVLYSFRVMYYSMISSKKNFKLTYMNEWDSINNSLFYLFGGVVVQGSCIYWLMMLKFNLIFLYGSMKLINVLLILLALMIFIDFIGFEYYYLKFLSNNFFLGMMYMGSMQGLFLVKIYKNSMVFSTCIEQLNEVLVFKNFGKILSYMIKMMSMFKLYLFYLIIIYFFIFLFLINFFNM